MGLINRIRNLGRRERVDAEIEAEVRSRIEMAVEEAMRVGSSESRARRAARLRFGSPVAVREPWDRMRRWASRGSGGM